MTVAEDSKDLTFVAIDKAIIPPPGLIEHFKDKYWCVHPSKGIIFWKKHSPQCNSNEEITKRILSSMYPWAEVKFIPSVFRTIHPQDYV